MGVVGKSPNQRHRVSVPSTFSEAAPSAATSSTPQETAAYIAEICVELARMAKGADLGFLAHLLAMAQAEAEHVAEHAV